MKTIECISAATCDYFGLTDEELRGPKRDRYTVNARRVAYFICRERGMSLTKIGDHFNRDHTSILRALMGVNMRDIDFLEDYSQVSYIAQGLINAEKEKILANCSALAGKDTLGQPKLREALGGF